MGDTKLMSAYIDLKEAYLNTFGITKLIGLLDVKWES